MHLQATENGTPKTLVNAPRLPMCYEGEIRRFPWDVRKSEVGQKALG